MKNLLELLQIARVKGFTKMQDDLPLPMSSRQELADFFDLAEECQPFVFARKNVGPVDISVEDDEVLDAPFRVFSMEMNEGCLTVSKGGVHTLNDSSPNIEAGRCDIACIMCVETAPHRFTYYALVDMGKLEGKRVVQFTDLGQRSIETVAIEFMRRLRKESWGQEKVRERVKIGVGSSKRTVTYRGVIHIAPDKQAGSYSESLGSRQVDWSTAWKVRGHWRRHDGLGKDRSGRYCVSGMTWVTDHVKGNKALEPLARVRMVE